MATNLALASIKATGGTTSRTFGARFADIINVKDYGATGDGSTDDTAAIQAAFDAAFGPVSSPHGTANAVLNKPVFFPNGNYKITSSINCKAVMAPWIFGTGPGSTILTWAGSSPGGSTLTKMFDINGMAYGVIEGMEFIMQGPGAAVSTYNSVCINWDWDGVAAVNGTTMVFRNLLMANSTYGILVGLTAECDDSIFENVSYSNVWYGMKTCNGNALGHTVIQGGGNTFLGALYYCSSGSIPFIISAGGASGNSTAVDIINNGGGPMTVIGSRSESANFFSQGPSTTLSKLVGINHDSVTQGYFCQCQGSVSIEDSLSVLGILDGNNHKGQIFVKNSSLYRYDFKLNVLVIELENSWIGNPGGMARAIVDQRITEAQGTRTYKIEASSLSDPQFLYDSYTGQGVPTIGAQGGYVTMTIASPAVLTLSGAAGPTAFQAGIPVAFTTDGSLPTGISTGTVYFISNDGLSTTTFRLADTLAHALAGTNSINTSGSQSGNQTMYFVRTYAVGDTVLKNNVAAGGSPGWICTTAGLAVGVAVFKALANVAA